MPATQFDLNAYRSTLLVALELSHQSWKLAFYSESAGRVRIRTIPARDMLRLEGEIQCAKAKLGLKADAPVQTCYEAGRDGFWIHRVLVSLGLKNFVIESSSLEVDRRRRTLKTDRLDAEKMVFALARHCRGERRALRVNHVPATVDEDLRNLQRELSSLRTECTRYTNRIKGLLVAQGIVLDHISKKFPEKLDSLETGDGKPVGQNLRQRLLREFTRLQLGIAQIREVETARAEIIRTGFDESTNTLPQADIAARLMELCGIGVEAGWTLSTELFAWRNFRNRRQVGAIVGLTPTPYSSGNLNHEQGISKSGRGQLRCATRGNLLALAQVSAWQRTHPVVLRQGERAGLAKSANRHRWLVRKLLVALWKFIAHGEIPEGVELKQPAQWKRIRFTPSLGCTIV